MILNRLIIPAVFIFITAAMCLAQPPQPAINPGEFEPMSGVIIAFPPPVPMELVAEISEDAQVMSVVPDESTMQSAINAYSSNGVNVDNCTFLICPSNSGLTRDCGPWYIFTGTDIQGIADNIHNQGLPEDSLPQYIGDSLNIPVYQTGLVIQGGNWMSDGMGRAMCSGMIYTQNPSYTQEQIQEILQRYLGIANCLVLEGFGGFGNVHIDTWGKFLDPGRVIVKRFNPPVPELEEMVHYISTLKSSYGRPYEVLRIDNDYTTSYTNCLFMNNKVLVPTNNGHPLDSLALETYREAMPGYEVLGFGPGWGPGNALHCRTMGITDRYMLRITHIPIFDRENDGENYIVEANVHPYSNMPLLPGMPQVYWKAGGGNYNILTMTHTVGDSFTAAIPSQPDGTDIYYYIHAEDDSNRSENHPYIGPGNPHHFYAGPDLEPPTVETIIPETLLPLSLPLTVTAEVRDNRWISSVTLEYLINGVPADTLEMTLQPLSAVIYETVFDPDVTPGDQVQLRIKAIDNSVNQNLTYAPEAGYYQIDIVGTLGICVWNPCAQPSGEVIYEYLERTGMECYYTEEEPAAFNRFLSMFVCLGSWPSTYHMSLDQVNKIVDYIDSGHRIYLEGTDAWAYSPYHDLLSEAFGIIGIYDGPLQSNVNPLSGVTGTFTEGMSFNCNNFSYVDHLFAAPGSNAIFVHADTAYGVVQETLNSKTVGLSVEFGGLSGNNAASSKPLLLKQILRFFRGAPVDWAEGDAVEEPAEVVTQFGFKSVYPNPFNPVTTIAFGLPEAGKVSLVIYDITGREVQSLINSHLSLGEHEAVWDAEGFSSGIYFARLDNGKAQMTQKLLLIK